MSIRDERKQQSRQALLDAALHLSTSGRSFSSISLREVAREVGLVPTAFYRHFQDMDELGKELVDQVALHLKSVLHQLGQSYLQHKSGKTQTSIELFVQAVNHSPKQWQFMIAERWGGSETVRAAIAREIEFLIEDLTTDLTKLENFKHIQNPQDLNVLSTILTNMSFTWAMTWLNLSKQYQGEQLKLQQTAFIENASTQVRLLFRGIANWER
ncbi:MULTISPECIES: TetR family transcriptional regulator [Acinetobacter]|uniref:TetR family transcriptional regulator n=1 Tax=Acinetobacter TaxID=469 RepID=UPI00044710C8|nr:MULTISPECIES: TetR family transcriptional regulator [Acinetobacter]AZB93730.1 TetR family transcriptional regulator [Acinetobacter pittii]EXC27612.1 bacterial regulatory s, tetR family protein [Acinetobacter sp. 809848]EXH34780.1 bacterial regulatory s, tetR family protein [Acinetobacter sp. 1245249]EYT28799.1 bacterial regulatory s, tetR family protein [Acinetobacter sp. 1564232]MDA3494377.1 TetR family transcriptional regulator [Acinetobacter sp. AOR33_HL]